MLPGKGVWNWWVGQNTRPLSRTGQPRRTRIAVLIMPLAVSILTQGSPLSAWQASGDTATDSEAKAMRYEPVERMVRIGAVVKAATKGIRAVNISLPVPTDWPEQHVSLFNDDMPSDVSRVAYKNQETVVQMQVTIPKITGGNEVDFEALFDVTVYPIPYPERTDHLVIPPRPPREIRLHTQPGPMIESRTPDIRKQAEALIEGIEAPWEQVRAFYTWTIESIDVAKGRDEVGAEKVMETLSGSPEDRCYAFIALCRSQKIPARMVWADRGEYAEFYLQDDTGEGRWYPVVLEGQTEFGSMSNPRVIFQKGDNHKVPESRERLVYVTEFISGRGKLQSVRWKQDVLPPRER